MPDIPSLPIVATSTTCAVLSGKHHQGAYGVQGEIDRWAIGVSASATTSFTASVDEAPARATRAEPYSPPWQGGEQSILRRGTGGTPFGP